MHALRRRPAGDVNAASMSDIAFLLLIFFLVTTIFALEKGIPLLLPPEKAPSQPVGRSNLLIIQAHANGGITIDRKPVGLNQVRVTAEERLAANPKLVVLLETHPDSQYGVMVDVLDELRLADVTRISLKQMTTQDL